MKRPDFSLCENKGADQLCSNCTADQHHCFCYMASTIPLCHISKNSSFQPASVTVHADLCRTWSETPKTGFLRLQLKQLISRVLKAQYLIIYKLSIIICMYLSRSSKCSKLRGSKIFITKTCPCNGKKPLIPHFYIVKLGCIEECLFSLTCELMTSTYLILTYIDHARLHSYPQSNDLHNDLHLGMMTLKL